MTTLPKLTTTRDFGIEVKRTPKNEIMNEESNSFVVRLTLADGEQRTFVVRYEAFLDFDSFRAAALFGANVLLRHIAEERTPDGRAAWMEFISGAIERSATAPQHQPKAG